MRKLLAISSFVALCLWYFCSTTVAAGKLGCVPTGRVRIVVECIAGTSHKKRQAEYQCNFEGYRWTEWRDQDGWVDTGALCQ